MPTDPEEAAAVMADYRALIERGDLDRQGLFGDLRVVSVPEGAIDPAIDGLERSSVAPILEAIEQLRHGLEERRALARRSLDSALAGLPEATEKIAAEVQREQEAAAALRKGLEASYSAARNQLTREIESGTFLRAEVLRQWLDFVNAGPFTRFLSEGVGRIAATIRNVLRPAAPAATPEVREVAFADLVASVVRHADAAASRAAAEWVEEPHGAVAVSREAGLWGASPGLAPDLNARLEQWMEEIGDEIRTIGAESAREGRRWRASASTSSVPAPSWRSSSTRAVSPEPSWGSGPPPRSSTRSCWKQSSGKATLRPSSTVPAAVSTRYSTLFSMRRSSVSSTPSARCRNPPILPLSYGRSPMPRPGQVGRDSVSAPGRGRRGRTDLGLTDHAASARELVEQIERRLGFPGEVYVLALAGGTGVGKSSVLNALAGDIRQPGPGVATHHRAARWPG